MEAELEVEPEVVLEDPEVVLEDPEVVLEDPEVALLGVDLLLVDLEEDLLQHSVALPQSSCQSLWDLEQV